MYNGYVRTTRVLIRQEIMEILSLRSNAMLLPPIFYFSYFAMNIKTTCSFLSLLASDTCILSKKLIKVLSKLHNRKLNHGNGKFLMFVRFMSDCIILIFGVYQGESIHIIHITVCAFTPICIPGHVHSLAGADYLVLWSLSCAHIWPRRNLALR